MADSSGEEPDLHLGEAVQDAADDGILLSEAAVRSDAQADAPTEGTNSPEGLVPADSNQAEGLDAADSNTAERYEVAESDVAEELHAVDNNAAEALDAADSIKSEVPDAVTSNTAEPIEATESNAAEEFHAANGDAAEGLDGTDSHAAELIDVALDGNTEEAVNAADDNSAQYTRQKSFQQDLELTADATQPEGEAEYDAADGSSAQYSRQKSFQQDLGLTAAATQPEGEALAEERPVQDMLQPDEEAFAAEQQPEQQASADELPQAELPQAELVVEPAVADASSVPNQADKTAATISKELRKLQAESAVLQEHSRRLQEKAAVMQQQRTSADQTKQGQQDSFKRRLSQQSESDSVQYGNGTEGDKEAAYQYSSDTSLPVQDGGLQWSIGGVPLQQQLRMLAVDNGMAMDEQAAGQGRSSGGSDTPGQGLQWGAGPSAASPTKKKISPGTKGAKDGQAGSINSVGALHDARNKQVPLNPLRTRKSSIGQAANPAIRQQSILHQAQAKQGRSFADTLRKHSQQEGGGNEGSPQAQSPDPQEPFYPNRALADVYGGSLESSKSEPHGLYAKGTPQGGYPSLALEGPPKAASVHDMDISPSQPHATKRRGKGGHNPTSAPGLNVQNWGHPGAPFMGMAGGPGMQAGMMQGGQGMMSSMYNQQAMAHLPQLAQPHMGGNMMGYGPMMPQQQGFGNMNPGQGAVQAKGSRRNLGTTRQAGSALKVAAGNPMMAAQPMQQGNFNDPYGQNYGASQMGTIPAYQMQYAPPGNQAYMGQPQMMPGQYGTLPPVGYPGMQPNSMHGGMGGMHPGMGNSRQHKKGRLPGGQTNYMQQGGAQYGAALPMAHSGHLHAGYHQQQGMPGMNYPAMQQRADAVQQYQMQQYQQMEASVMQQLHQKQDHALLKYGNFDTAQYRQPDLQSRPEFRTY